MVELYGGRYVEGGKGWAVRFPNGYGASVICCPGSYGYEEGLSELAVLKFRDEETDLYDLCYDTPITYDVEGYLTDEDVSQLLREISELERAY